MPKIKQIKIGSTTYDLSIPLATASDNNKVLTVVNGEWAAAAVPTELPSVTASDNGKVLAVSSGSWAAVTPSSGGGGSGSSEVVYITMEDDGTMTYNGNSIDSSDIISLYDSGKDVRAKWYIDPQDDDIYYVLYLNYVDHSQFEIVEFKGIGKVSGILKTIVAWASVDDSDIANLEFYQLETVNSYNASCYTAAGTASKIISLSSNTPFDLQTGAQIAVKFTYGNTVTNPVIVIGTTAKQILYHGGNLTSTTIKANDTVLLQYNGSSFDIIAIDRQAAAELPSVSASDNGKFVRVVNGAYAVQTVPAAESNSFGGGA